MGEKQNMKCNLHARYNKKKDEKLKRKILLYNIFGWCKIHDVLRKGRKIYDAEYLFQ